MYVCMVTHIARVWINQVRLPVLHVVSLTGKMDISMSAFAPENLVSRDGFGSPVPRQPTHLHTQAGSGAYLRDSSQERGSVHLLQIIKVKRFRLRLESCKIANMELCYLYQPRLMQ